MLRRALLFTILVMSLVCMRVQTASSEPASPELFSLADAPGNPAEDNVPTIRRRFVRPNLALLAPGAELTLNLFEDSRFPGHSAVATDHAGPLQSWSLRLDGSATDSALLVVHDGSVTGRIAVGKAVYQIIPVGGPVHEIRQIDVGALPAEAEPETATQESFPGRLALGSEPVMRSVSSDAVDAIRVLVVYTPAVAAASSDVLAEAQLDIDVANDAYARSNMVTRIQLAAAVEVDYVESGDISVDLARLRSPGDGYLDEVPGLRNAYLADFVSLLSADGGGYCGMAKLMSTVSPTFESSAFNVVWLPCASSNWSTAHELGHNMGCQHDRANAATSPAFPYAFGFQDPEGDFRTIMAINAGCPGDCPRIGYFSNPDVDYLGQATGVPLDATQMAACALAIDATSATTTDFRTLVEPTDVSASATFSNRVEISFSHPWPWGFQVYRAESGAPMEPLTSTGGSPLVDTSAAPGVSYDYWVSALTALGEQSGIAGPVTGRMAIPVCGNDVVESPAEECDDGNTTSDDGCDSGCASEVALVSGTGRCVAMLNARAVRVSKTQGRQNIECVVDAIAGSEPDPDGCLSADPKGRVDRAREKLLEADADMCSELPPYGYAGGLVAADAAIEQRKAVLHDMFGTILYRALRLQDRDPEAAVCQKAMAKAVDRLIGSYLDSFVDCKKSRIHDGSVFQSRDIDGCFDAIVAEASDPGSSIAMSAARLSLALQKNCAVIVANEVLGNVFPGRCATLDAAVMDSCLTARVVCRTCLLFNQADALERDCDVLDNGLSDSSCAP